MTSLTVFRANFAKIGIEMARYLPNTLSLVVTYYAIFLALFFGIRVIGDPGDAAGNIRFLIVANTFWFLMILGISSMGWEITTEATRGTLEQLYMSPVGAWRILLARAVATLLLNVAIMAGMLVLSMLTAGQWLNLDLVAIALILIPTFVGMIGLSYLVAGLAIVYKQVQSLLQILQFVFLGLAFVPLSLAPGLEAAPIVKGVDMVRQVMVDDRSLGAFGAGDWASLVLNGALTFALGLGLFKLCERRALDRGLLGQY